MTDELDPGRPLGGRDGRKDLFLELGRQIEAFLLRLEASPEDLSGYVRNRVAFLNTVAPEELSDEAKALLLESNYSVIQEVMSERGSTAVRWVCVWVI
jgi:hypothetical protein